MRPHVEGFSTDHVQPIAGSFSKPLWPSAPTKRVCLRGYEYQQAVTKVNDTVK